MDNINLCIIKIISTKFCEFLMKNWFCWIFKVAGFHIIQEFQFWVNWPQSYGRYLHSNKYLQSTWTYENFHRAFSSLLLYGLLLDQINVLLGPISWRPSLFFGSHFVWKIAIFSLANLKNHFYIKILSKNLTKLKI